MGHNPGYAQVCNEETELLAVFWHLSEGNMSGRTKTMLDYCTQKKIETIQHSRLNKEIHQMIASMEPDLIIVGEYHFILKRELFEIPRYGAINLHGAPLPRYRGAHPINWMIINGETEGAVTCHYITDGLDNGDIISQYTFPILETETAYDIRPKIESTGRRLLVDVLRRFKVEGKVAGTLQNEENALYTPPRKPDDGLIDWDKPPKQVYDFVRALTRPYPGAFALHNGKKVYLWHLELPGGKDIINDNKCVAPGTIVDKWERGFKVAVKGGTVTVLDWESDGIDLRIMDRLIGES